MGCQRLTLHKAMETISFKSDFFTLGSESIFEYTCLVVEIISCLLFNTNIVSRYSSIKSYSVLEDGNFLVNTCVTSFEDLKAAFLVFEFLQGFLHSPILWQYH